ncbi:MAG: hypothetical protein PHT07_01635 [Paludibacter sp.]|nr:hypothetical protein [Paludibacter sp.]
MKLNYILPFLILMISNILFAKDLDFKNLKLVPVEIMDAKIDSVLNNVGIKNQKHLNQKGLIAFEIVKVNKLEYNINIVIYNRVLFDRFCQNNKYPIKGYLYFHDYLVFVVGNIENSFIYKTKNVKMFKFKYNNFKNIKLGIPPPPSLYDPPTYIYKCKNGKIQLLNRNKPIFHDMSIVK